MARPNPTEQNNGCGRAQKLAEPRLTGETLRIATVQYLRLWRDRSLDRE
jgi:hypothetical protein